MAMNNTQRPVIVPSALSSGTVLWCIVFGLYFAAALCMYNAWCRLTDAEGRLASPSSVVIDTGLYSCRIPDGVRRYSLDGDRLVMYFSERGSTPLTAMGAIRDPSIKYRAIDINPALGALNIQRMLESIGVIDKDSKEVPVVLGCDHTHIKPGVMSARFYYDLGDKEGLAYACCLGDTVYFTVSLWDDGLRIDVESLRVYMLAFFKGVDFRVSPDCFARPYVNTAELTSADHERIIAEVTREKMLWQMFADRVATEPESALVSAIEHYRKALELLSSVREEREELSSPDFLRYEGFLMQRARVVREWFVIMDKHLATGDDEAAKKQAEFIQRHATLIEESLDRRRAADVLERLVAREQKGGK